MKTKIIFSFLFSFLYFGQSLTAQEVPIVSIEQGEIIGALPYGRHFFINGSSTLPSGQLADSIVVRIYKTGNRDLFKKRRNIKTLTPINVNNVTAGGNKSPYFVKESTWLLYRSENKEQYRVYINQPLLFATQYLVEVNYFKRFNFTFTEVEKDIILDNVVNNLVAHYQKNGESLTDEDAANYLNLAVLNVMKKKTEVAGESFLGFGDILENNPIIEASSITSLSEDYLSLLAATKAEIQSTRKDIATKQKQLNKATGNDAAALEEAIQELESTLSIYDDLVAENEIGLNKRLKIIKKQLALVVVDSPIAPTTPSGVTELDAIKVGTAFGGGGIFYNPKNPELREINALSYAALKFYFLPVDKRIDEPYLSDFPLLNRMALLFGVVTSGAFEYRGQQLEKPIGLSPVAGLSFDFNRYFSLDAGFTVFRQPSTSPYLSRKQTRFAPVVGITFDFDAFNRIKSMTGGEGPYNIPLAP